jgi:hypothetical protein
MAPPDWNWADFCGARLAEMLAEHADQLPAALAGDMRAALGHAGWSIFRRNVQPGYTNIAIMGAGVTLAAGELLDEPRLLDYGRRRLAKMVRHTEYHGGFNEYNSPTYTLVALYECERIMQLVRDATARHDAEALRRIAWTTIAEHFHPATGQWAGPHSRCYADRLAGATVEFLAQQTGVPVGGHDVLGGQGRPAPLSLVRHLPCPPDLVDRFRRLPEPEVTVTRSFIRREHDATTGTTWLSEDACLGTVNRDTLWTQRRPLLAYWRTPADPAVVLRLRCIHDGRDFASAEVRNHQEGRRVLSLVSLVTGQGDFHPSLDRPRDGVFEMRELRVRYELSGQGVTAADLGDGRYELAAGDWRAVVHSLPSSFNGQPVAWRLDTGDGAAAVEATVYDGPARPLEPAQDELAVAAGLELLGCDEALSEGPRGDDGSQRLEWVAHGLAVMRPS